MLVYDAVEQARVFAFLEGAAELSNGIEIQRHTQPDENGNVTVSFGPKLGHFGTGYTVAEALLAATKRWEGAGCPTVKRMAEAEWDALDTMCTLDVTP